MGTHLRVLSASYPMNTNMTGFRWFQKYLHPCALDKSSLSIGRVKLPSEIILRSLLYNSIGSLCTIPAS